MPVANIEKLAEALIEISAEAGAVIMDVFNAGFEVETKDDDSPVTIADQRAEDVILAGLAEAAPGIPVIAEELFAAGQAPDVASGPFFLVDPLDGTKEFINRRDAFTVNIALIEARRPVLGVVYAPATDRLYCGLCGGDGPATAFRIEGLSAGGRTREPLATRPTDPAHLTIVASKSHRNPATEAYLAQYPEAETVSIGSSLKFCLVAAGEADFYPRLGPTMEWDTGAGHAVLLAAGGDVLAPDGTPFEYLKPGFKNGFFLARGDRDFLPHLPKDDS